MLKIDIENELASEDGLMMLPGGSDCVMRVVGRDLVGNKSVGMEPATLKRMRKPSDPAPLMQKMGARRSSRALLSAKPSNPFPLLQREARPSSRALPVCC